jgi:hypothetical protein
MIVKSSSSSSSQPLFFIYHHDATALQMHTQHSLLRMALAKY